jgi:hypothetical protein
MGKELALPAGKKVKVPTRPPDMHSKRGVPYWFSPEWVRGDGGRIKAIKEDDEVYLYMLSKTGNLTYIQGSIQCEFDEWHEANEIDCILLGIDEDQVLLTDWEYE